MNIAYLTVEQKDQLVGEQYANDSYFNPIQDVAGNWVISEEEINFCTNPNFLFVKSLTLSVYNPKPQTIIEGI
jgi:hypothetical protein